MIDTLRLLYPAGPPDLCSPEYVAVLRDVGRAQSWVRLAFLLIGGLLASLVVALVAFTLVPGLRIGGIPGGRGRLTTAGLIVVVLLGLLALGSLYMYRTLHRDVAPYLLPAETLCRFLVREGRIVRFGSWTSFGSRWSRFERIYWTTGGADGIEGRTPFVRALLSVWLDHDDVVYIGVDPHGTSPPLFLGAAKPAPAVLQGAGRPPLAALHAALKEHFRTSRRWRGNTVRDVWGIDDHR